jgi:hypothetical protein
VSPPPLPLILIITTELLVELDELELLFAAPPETEESGNSLRFNACIFILDLVSLSQAKPSIDLVTKSINLLLDPLNDMHYRDADFIVTVSET